MLNYHYILSKEKKNIQEHAHFGKTTIPMHPQNPILTLRPNWVGQGKNNKIISHSFGNNCKKKHFWGGRGLCVGGGGVSLICYMHLDNKSWKTSENITILCFQMQMYVHLFCYLKASWDNGGRDRSKTFAYLPNVSHAFPRRHKRRRGVCCEQLVCVPCPEKN